jgi:hypothetical protein
MAFWWNPAEATLAQRGRQDGATPGSCGVITVAILRANEAHDRVHLKGVIAFGEAIGAGSEGELIPAVMGGCRQG